MRIIAGKYRSRPLKSLPGLDIRPTSDRLRETLFNVLTGGNPESLVGRVFVDLYAGTGAVGIEALSRGARQVFLVESSKKAVALVRKNLRSLGVDSGFEIINRDVVVALRQLEAREVRADFVFLDPPYRLCEEYERTLSALADSRILNPKAMVIAEHERKFDPADEVQSLRRFRVLRQGDAALSFYR